MYFGALVGEYYFCNLKLCIWLVLNLPNINLMHGDEYYKTYIGSYATSTAGCVMPTYSPEYIKYTMFVRSESAQ
jgi:hypothetical protein